VTGTTLRALLGGVAAAPFAAGAATAEQRDERLMLWADLPPGSPATLPVPEVEQRFNDPSLQIRWLTGIDRPAGGDLAGIVQTLRGRARPVPPPR